MQAGAGLGGSSLGICHESDPIAKETRGAGSGVVQLGLDRLNHEKDRQMGDSLEVILNWLFMWNLDRNNFGLSVRSTRCWKIYRSELFWRRRPPSVRDKDFIF